MARFRKDKQLGDISSQLQKAQDMLILEGFGAQVGVMENPEEGSSDALDQAGTMSLNFSVENWPETAGRKTTVADNEFEQDTQTMTGDQGGDAAKGSEEEIKSHLERKMETLCWLSGVDYPMTHYDIQHRREPGTGQWLLESETFKTWCVAELLLILSASTSVSPPR
jgi:hypothetical protein